MVAIGEYNTLKVVKEVDFGLYLDGGDEGEILIPTRYIPEGTKVDDDLEVFLYFDSEDRLIATTEKPVVCVNQFALLEVVGSASVGAFLDWGLPKDLLLPFAEQKQKPEVGDKVMVYVRIDSESDRLVASAKVERFLDNTIPEFETDDEVDLLIFDKTDMGYKAIINGTHSGLIYKNEVFTKLAVGDTTKGYIKKLRDDDKIDISLQKPGFEKVDDSAQLILDYLQQKGGSMPITDKSHANEISNVFGISKKTFKKAIGTLYKQKRIVLNPTSIELA